MDESASHGCYLFIWLAWKGVNSSQSMALISAGYMKVNIYTEKRNVTFISTYCEMACFIK